MAHTYVSNHLHIVFSTKNRQRLIAPEWEDDLHAAFHGIAREHRFSTGQHWRHGVLLEDADKKHRGLVRAVPNERLVELSVRGPYPQNFFALLRDGQEDPVLILDDVFAELDTGRRDRLAGLVAGAEQVLITAAVPADIPAVLVGARFTVRAGVVAGDG